ncbi:MAG TPA: hypothetical protein VHC90_16530 [Bryobacteraceae bacterium]|nr:hypothetical protein [Bryobacteraceae bacterium]
MHDDNKLSELLKEWQLPGAPASLDARVLAPRKPWWMHSIRIPVPLAFAIAAALVFMAVALLRRPPAPPQSTSVNLADFQPVKNMNVRIIRSGE